MKNTGWWIIWKMSNNWWHNHGCKTVKHPEEYRSMNDIKPLITGYITTTKQSKTKPCVYSMGYTVVRTEVSDPSTSSSPCKVKGFPIMASIASCHSGQQQSISITYNVSGYITDHTTQTYTIYPIEYAYGLALFCCSYLCELFVDFTERCHFDEIFITGCTGSSCYVFTHILESCFTGTGEIIWLPQYMVSPVFKINLKNQINHY